MKNRLVLTLTTSQGSYQVSLNKLLRNLVAVSILVVLVGFVLGNFFLVKTSSALSSLETDHNQLEHMYADVLGARELYKSEMDQLSDTLSLVKTERNRLQQEFSLMAVKYNGVLTDSRENRVRAQELNTRIENVQEENQQLRQESDVVLSERSQWAAALRKLEQKMGLPAAPAMTLERSLELQQIANERLFMLRGIPNGSPLKNGLRMTDDFGMRIHPVTGEKKLHNGVDWRAKMGTPVYATADGAVEWSGFHKSSGYGNLVIINHNFGFKSYYGHMKKLVVRSGTLVRKGELIGYSGNSGISTGPHLHYEVRYLFKALDPAPFVDWGMNNYEPIFTQVKGVSWASLRGMHPLNQIEAPLL